MWPLLQVTLLHMQSVLCTFNSSCHVWWYQSASQVKLCMGVCAYAGEVANNRELEAQITFYEREMGKAREQQVRLCTLRPRPRLGQHCQCYTGHVQLCGSLFEHVNMYRHWRQWQS